MKVLLVALNAKYIHSNLAVYSLKSYAEKYSDQIDLLELTINHSEEDILREIYRRKADVIAFSCYIWNISIIKRVSVELKKVLPKVKIWYGGPEVSYDARESLKGQEYLDGIMIGEGEQTFLELMGYYTEGNIELEHISGLAFKPSAKLGEISENIQSHDEVAKFGENILKNPPQLEITMTGVRTPISLDSIPFPYEDMELFRNRIIYYESSRGCPFSCSYCLSSIDHRVRFRSADLVKRELKLFLDYEIPQVKFVDRTFNCNKKHAMDIWSFIKEHDNGITNFHFELSADLLDEEEITFLSTLRPGQVQFEIGVQTTNPDTAAAIHRKMNMEKLVKNVLRIKEGKNIHQHLDLIAGLPLEGYKSFEQSFVDVYQLRPDQLQLGFLKILKGSMMEEDVKRYGITYHETPPYEVLFTSALTFDEVIRMKGICEMVEIYYNSGQFHYALLYLEHYYSSPMKLYEALYDYYEETGYSLVSHSRIKRYEILLDFFRDQVLQYREEEKKATLEQLFSEILMLDLFLREDMKSRPAFAPEQSKTNNSLRELYQKYRDIKRWIHIEEFKYDVIASAKTGQPVKKNLILIFDYSKRDPLNKGAKITILDSEALILCKTTRKEDLFGKPKNIEERT